jgi:hypothetical protein
MRELPEMQPRHRVTGEASGLATTRAAREPTAIDRRMAGNG